MRLAVLYDARVHLPAFHALKAWRLAVMASSTSLFHHQVSRRHRWGFVTVFFSLKPEVAGKTPVVTIFHWVLILNGH